MSLVLDHFFILASPGAPEGDRLLELGMTHVTENDHPGQGTSNRRFGELELIHVRDETEALTGAGKRLRIAQRAADALASPFGLIFRDNDCGAEPPFASWRYYPDYFNGEHYFCVGNNSEELREPACFFMAFWMEPPVDPPDPPPAFSAVTGVTVSMPREQPSPTLEAIQDCPRLALRYGEPHLMQVEYNDWAASEVADLRPELPLIVRW